MLLSISVFRWIFDKSNCFVLRQFVLQLVLFCTIKILSDTHCQLWRAEKKVNVAETENSLKSGRWRMWSTKVDLARNGSVSCSVTTNCGLMRDSDLPVRDNVLHTWCYATVVFVPRVNIANFADRASHSRSLKETTFSIFGFTPDILLVLIKLLIIRTHFK